MASSESRRGPSSYLGQPGHRTGFGDRADHEGRAKQWKPSLSRPCGCAAPVSSSAGVVLGLDSGLDLAGLVRDTPAATATLLGLVGNRTVAAREASGGIGGPGDERFGAP